MRLSVYHSAFCHPERNRSSAKRTICGVEGPLPLMRTLIQHFNRMRRLAAAILREIFDEAAYERFLSRQNERASVDSYAAFRRDHEQQNLRRPRCC